MHSQSLNFSGAESLNSLTGLQFFRLSQLGSCYEMGMDWFLIVLQIFLFITAVPVHSQPSPPDSSSFISIDCGIADGTTTIDNITGLTYVSDKMYTEMGINSAVSSEYLSLTSKVQSTLRYFPNGTRNCYTLKPVLQYQKYILRAMFSYGNYDGQHKANHVKPLQFDLHIDVNLWTTVNITDETSTFTKEAIIVSLVNNSVSVCLINTDNGVPFISSLELRPIGFDMYKHVNATQYFLLHHNRSNMGANISIRYPTDPYDRIWNGKTWWAWANISTNMSIGHYPDSIDELRAPSAVMQTAVIPGKPTTDLEFYWTFSDSGFSHNVFYAYLHFSELVAFGPNQSRAFDILLNDDTFLANYSPPYLIAEYVYSDFPLPTNLTYDWKLVRNATSTLPPILNAWEIYSVMYITNQPTRTTDVDAITAIKEEYKVKKYWTGDPCAPREYMWDGLNCSYDPEPPTIIAVSLSSSGLTGDISPLFGKLAAIKYLDLSYNNLTGRIPDALGDLSSLQVLNLCGNNISRKIPTSLMKGMNDSLQIIFDCPNPVPKKSKLIILIPSVFAGVVVLLIVSLFAIWSIKKSRQGPVPSTPIGAHKEDHPKAEEHPIKVDSMKFTHKQLAKITNNFSRYIGRGGFGNVYYGCVEAGTEVAVKIHSQSSPLGSKQFLAEVQNLTSARHRNLVKLIGYCIDDKSLALVYEYMPHGSLKECLKGIAGRVLSWQKRIQIAIGAAQGLEYLHKWCSPLIIHRDIKSANILLDKDLEAKLADFGVSKAFSYNESHVSTNTIVGTPGYVDPEYHYTFQLTEKSDVFSFGVVLLELLTGQPHLVPHSGKPHLIQLVASMAVGGSIDEIVDQRLEGDFDENSAWKIVELAKLCTDQKGAQRPTMTEVVIELRDCLELEVARLKREHQGTQESNSSENTTFEIGGITAGPVGPLAR